MAPTVIGPGNPQSSPGPLGNPGSPAPTGRSRAVDWPLCLSITLGLRLPQPRKSRPLRSSREQNCPPYLSIISWALPWPSRKSRLLRAFQGRGWAAAPSVTSQVGRGESRKSRLILAQGLVTGSVHHPFAVSLGAGLPPAGVEGAGPFPSLAPPPTCSLRSMRSALGCAPCLLTPPSAALAPPPPRPAPAAAPGPGPPQRAGPARPQRPPGS